MEPINASPRVRKLSTTHIDSTTLQALRRQFSTILQRKYFLVNGTKHIVRHDPGFVHHRRQTVLRTLLAKYQTLDAISNLDVDTINSCFDLVHAQPPVQPLIQILATLCQRTPRSWLKVHSNMRNFHTDVLQNILDILEEAKQCTTEILKHTKETPKLTSQEQTLVNSFVLDCVKARKYVILFLHTKIQSFVASLTKVSTETWDTSVYNVFRSDPLETGRNTGHDRAICQFGSQNVIIANICLNRTFICRDNMALLLPTQGDCTEIFEAMETTRREMQNARDYELLGPHSKQLLTLKAAFGASRSSDLLYAFQLVGPGPSALKNVVQRQWYFSLWKLHGLSCRENFINNHLSPNIGRCRILRHTLILIQELQRTGFEEKAKIPEDRAAGKAVDKKHDRLSLKSHQWLRQLAMEQTGVLAILLFSLSATVWETYPREYCISDKAFHDFFSLGPLTSHMVANFSLACLFAGIIFIMAKSPSYSLKMTNILSASVGEVWNLLGKARLGLLDCFSQWPNFHVEYFIGYSNILAVLHRVYIDPLTSRRSALPPSCVVPSKIDVKNSLIQWLSYVAKIVLCLCDPLPPLDPEKVRVKWKCRCGCLLFDDFIETYPGAARALQADLNHISKATAAGSWFTASDIKMQYHETNISDAPEGMQAANSRPIRLQDQQEPFDPSPRGRKHNSTIIECDIETHWLLVCARGINRPTSLSHMNICASSPDKMLFKKLRDVYHGIRSNWSSWFSLRTVQSIKFVQFELHVKDLVDIRKVPDMPPESKREEYIYQPCDLIPPVGENLMAHLFHHPEHANDISITCLRAPKRRNDKLAVCPHAGTSIGWGLQIVEGWVMSRIWLLMTSLFLLGSLVFGVCWAALRFDIQGAFAVSAYMLAFGTLIIGTLHAFLD